MNNQPATIEKIIALCKRRGLVYQTAEIYGGLNGIYDIGHLGLLLTNNIKKAWLDSLYNVSEDILIFDGSLLAPEAVWQASGHLQNFHDPMVDCQECKHRYRIDEIDLNKACPHCGKKKWTEVRQFHMMFKTEVGASAQHAMTAYLRPETAQSIFINFKNIISSNRIKIPFGVAQIGKAFRNEITPKQFLFRVREFEQMELEWFCQPDKASVWFDTWKKHRFDFYLNTIGLTHDKIRLRNHEADERSHYSQNTVDVEYQFPFGWKELEGIADRGNYDLTQHTQHSGKDLSVFDASTQTSYIPHVVECSAGVGRLFFTLLFDTYTEENVDGEIRIYLRIKPSLAPIKAAFLPLTNQQSDAMHAIYKNIQKTGLVIQFDDTGSIGKRYRRQDEIGTPLCFTYDFDSPNDNCVTMRHRDSMKQERISIDQINTIINKTMQGIY